MIVFLAVRDWEIWQSGHLGRLLFALVILVLLGVVFRFFVSKVLTRALTHAVPSQFENKAVVERRTRSLASTLNWGFTVILMFVGVAVVLSEFGLNVSAFIASIGIIGVALGLGAQLLIRDVINGMFILIEDQFGIGDTVSVAGVTGEVLDINPRRTVVLDADGNINSIPNSSITVATNKTSGLNRFVIEMQVAFPDDERAVELISEQCAALFKEWPDSLVAEPRIVEERAAPGSNVLIRIAGDARGARKWSVEAQLRARLVAAFDSEPLEVEFEAAPSAEDAEDPTLTRSRHRVSYVSPNPSPIAPTPPPP